MTAGAGAGVRAGAGEGAGAGAESQTGSESSQATPVESRPGQTESPGPRLARLDSQAEGFVYSSNLSAAFSLPSLPFLPLFAALLAPLSALLSQVVTAFRLYL